MILLSFLVYPIGIRYIAINITADSIRRTIVIAYILLYNKVLYYIICDIGIDKMF